MLTLDEILAALADVWDVANATDAKGAYLVPGYRAGVSDAWRDIVIAAEKKAKAQAAQANKLGSLNADMARRHDR